MRYTPVITIILTSIISVSSGQEEWMSKCGQCECYWLNGEKTADCTELNLTSIPTHLSDEIRALYLFNNPIYELPARAFENNSLQNIKILKMQNCNLEHVDELAFSNLGNLKDLDLSKNNIKVLHEHVFRENKELRQLSLNFNSIKALRGTLFHGLSHLHVLYLGNNQIEEVDTTIFDNCHALHHIDLSQNKLKYLDYQLLNNLTGILTLNLEDNPWVCDCKLEKLQDVVSRQHLLRVPTLCDAPPQLKGRFWSEIPTDDFVCPPESLES